MTVVGVSVEDFQRAPLPLSSRAGARPHKTDRKQLQAQFGEATVQDGSMEKSLSYVCTARDPLKNALGGKTIVTATVVVLLFGDYIKKPRKVIRELCVRQLSEY